jgi:hypothetical protein
LSRVPLSLTGKREHENRPVTIPELTQALEACLALLAADGDTMFTLPLKGLIKRADEQVPRCPVCNGDGNDPESAKRRLVGLAPCPRCNGTGALFDDG